ncbi:MAG: nitrogen regulation protein NR(II) [Methylococcales bacterium]|nr:nitrogen regulation protein NR(II) [Methylococcales bacterium]
MHKKILANLNEAVLLFNNELILTFINTAGEILLADSEKHLLGLRASKLFKLSDSALLIDLQQCLETTEALVDRELNLSHLNKISTVNFSATPIFEGGELIEILVELQQVDRQLRISKEEHLLTQQNTSRMLVKGLAHEIKNPLGGIRGAAQLLDIELISPELKEYTQIIIQESDRLKSLMDKMLGSNKPSIKKSLNIHEVLERVRQLTIVETHNDISFVVDYDPSIPHLKADKNQLIQVFLNIIQNAVQAMQQKGEVILKTRIQRHMTIGRKYYKLAIKIDIIDNGPGVKKGLMDQMFYPMITGRAEGTGLGLSIAQSLVNQHFGIIECQSEPGKTIFSIYLPMENYDAKS